MLSRSFSELSGSSQTNSPQIPDLKLDTLNPNQDARILRATIEDSWGSLGKPQLSSEILKGGSSDPRKKALFFLLGQGKLAALVQEDGAT